MRGGFTRNNIQPWRSRSGTSIFDLFDDFENMFSQALQPSSWEESEMSFRPTVDVQETDKAYVMSVDLPGVKKEDIHVDIEGQILKISGERRHQRVSGGEGNSRSERFYGRFERSFTLPTSVDRDKMEAHHENGVLEILLPKTPQMAGRKLEIQSGKPGFLSRLLGSSGEAKAKSGSSEESH